MAKGQVRSNKEVKKPKQDKKPSAPIASFGSAAAQANAQMNEAKKSK
jgi:hypothetical protein